MAAVNLLLMGRTGNGKSSIGNSILGQKKFAPRSVSSAISYIIKKETVVLGDKTVTVVDGPGIGDTITDITDDGQSIIELIEKALSLVAFEFHALILVLKYGIRFTNQEKDAVKLIKAILGEDVLKNYGIIVMSYGDSFDMDIEDERLTFEDWCSQQTGDIRILFNECGRRHILFNNRSTDSHVLKKQNEQLMRMVTDITKSRQPYGKDDFKNAERGRVKLRVVGKLPELESMTDVLLNNLSKELENISKNSSDHAKNIEDLTLISSKVEKHVKYLEEEDQGTGSIGSLLLNIKIIKTRVKTLTDLQIVRLKSAEIETAEPSRNISVPSQRTEPTSPRRTQPTFRQRCIGEVGPYICRFFERVKSAPYSRRSLFIYTMIFSLGGFICYKFYGRIFAKKLPEIRYT